MRLVYRSALALGFAAAMVSCGKSSSTSPSGDGGNNTTQNNAAVSIPVSDAYGQSSFQPGNVNITVGGTVQFSNNDAVEHHPTADDGSWNADLGAGGSANQKFAAAGTYTYHCSIHPNMTGTVVVK